MSAKTILVRWPSGRLRAGLSAGAVALAVTASGVAGPDAAGRGHVPRRRPAARPGDRHPGKRMQPRAVAHHYRQPPRIFPGRQRGDVEQAQVQAAAEIRQRGLGDQVTPAAQAHAHQPAAERTFPERPGR